MLGAFRDVCEGENEWLAIIVMLYSVPLVHPRKTIPIFSPHSLLRIYFGSPLPVFYLPFQIFISP